MDRFQTFLSISTCAATTRTFLFDLENREGAKLWIDGRLAVDNDFNSEMTSGSQHKFAHVHLTKGFHQAGPHTTHRPLTVCSECTSAELRTRHILHPGTTRHPVSTSTETVAAAERCSSEATAVSRSPLSFVRRLFNTSLICQALPRGACGVLPGRRVVHAYSPL